MLKFYFTFFSELSLKYSLLIFLCITNLKISSAQVRTSSASEIESIKSKVDSLDKLFYEYRYSNRDTVDRILEEALSLTNSIGYSKGKVRVLTNIGMNLYFKGEYTKALFNFIEALKLSHSLLLETNDQKKISALEEQLCGIHISVGNTYNYLQEINLAFLHYSKAEELAAKANAKGTLKQIMLMKGTLHQSMGNFEQASTIYSDLLAEKDTTDITDRSIPILHINLGETYYELNKLEKALDHNSIAHALFKKMSDKIGMVATQQVYGKIYLAQNRLSDALSYSHNALSVLDEMDDHRSRAQAYLLLGQIHDKTKKYDSAVYYSQKSLDLSLVNNLDETALKSCEHLLEIYKSKKIKHPIEDIYKLNTLNLELQSRLLNKTNEIELTDVISKDPIIADESGLRSDKFQITQIQDRIYIVLLVCLGIFLAEIVFIRFTYKSKSQKTIL